jgi:hypothetical protein
MRRININIDDSLTDRQAIDRVERVIDQGKISKGPNGVDQYCWLTTFRDGTGVYATVTQAGNATFTVKRGYE